MSWLRLCSFGAKVIDVSLDSDGNMHLVLASNDKDYLFQQAKKLKLWENKTCWVEIKIKT